MGFDITELVASLGAYNRVHAPELYSKLIQKEYSQKYFRTISGVKDEYVADEFLLTEILQPFQKSWTPKGDAAFSPEILKVRRIKIDMEFDPVDLERTWEGQRIDGSLPEGQELLEGYIFDQILVKTKKEIEYKVAYKGVYKVPVAGTPGAAQDSADGLLTILNNAITLNKIVPIPTGAITEANARDAFERVYDGVDPDYQDEELVCLASPQLIRWYKRDYRSEFGPNMDYVAMKKEGEEGPYLDGTNCLLLPIPGMNGSDKIIITTKANLLRLIDGKEEDDNLNLRFQVDKRIILVLGDFKMGWGFGIVEGLVWTNDTATEPTALTTVNKPITVDPVMEYLKKMRSELTEAQEEALENLRTELWGKGAKPGVPISTVTETAEFPGTTHVAPVDVHTVTTKTVAGITTKVSEPKKEQTVKNGRGQTRNGGVKENNGGEKEPEDPGNENSGLPGDLNEGLPSEGQQPTE